MRTFTMFTLLLSAAASLAAEPRLNLMGKEQHAWSKRLPEVKSDEFNRIKDSLTFYTRREMPQAYQHEGAVHSPSYNISAAQPTERFGNANIEFPWGGPAGLDRTPGTSDVKFVYFPPGKRITWWQASDNQGSYIDWRYPDGTVFGEVLTTRGLVFEIRTRTRTSSGWKVDVFRPFATPEELVKAVKEIAKSPLDRAFLDNRLLVSREIYSLADTNHDTPVFKRTGAYDYLPPLETATVAKLLKTTPFKSVAGQPWTEKSGVRGHSPTTKADFHIVPKDYRGPLLEVSNKACMTCHSTTGKHAMEFNFNRDWYGRVRGGDGIFSFHPFDPSCISHNGYPQQIVLNQKLAGLLKKR